MASFKVKPRRIRAPRLRYMVTSGFLGAGKTTAMIAFAHSINARYGKAAILANDLGAQNIVDAEYTATTDVMTTQISGNCICYQHENLVDKLYQLAARGADVILSDIPGCGIGALDHVYLELQAKEPGQFSLMPFTCIVDPERLGMGHARGGADRPTGGNALPPEGPDG